MRNLGRGALREIRQRRGFQPPALFSALFSVRLTGACLGSMCWILCWLGGSR